MAYQQPELSLAQQPPHPRGPTTPDGRAAQGSHPYPTGHQGRLAGQESTTGVSEACWALLLLCVGGQCSGAPVSPTG